MVVKTKSIYDTNNQTDGLRILVTRFYPRGIKRDRFDLWVGEASPKPDLLRAYKQGSIDWPEFGKRFKMQLTETKESIMAMKQLLQLSKNKNITLLCYEKEGEKCHRQILKSRLQNFSRRREKGARRRKNV